MTPKFDIAISHQKSLLESMGIITAYKLGGTNVFSQYSFDVDHFLAGGLRPQQVLFDDTVQISGLCELEYVAHIMPFFDSYSVLSWHFGLEFPDLTKELSPGSAADAALQNLLAGHLQILTPRIDLHHTYTCWTVSPSGKQSLFPSDSNNLLMPPDKILGTAFRLLKQWEFPIPRTLYISTGGLAPLCEVKRGDQLNFTQP